MSDLTLIENAPGGGSVLTKQRRYVLEVGEPSVLAGHLALSASAAPKGAGRPFHRLPVPFWLLVEEVETFKAAPSEIRVADSIIGQAYNAEYTIKYWILSDGASDLCPDQGGWFEAKFSRAPSCSSDHGRLTMHRPGLLIVDPQSIRRFRLGPYIQDRITAWAKKYWSKAEVGRVSLHSSQAETAEELITRNKFWERYGFQFIWTDPETMREGISEPMAGQALRVPLPTPDRYRHIRGLEIAHHLAVARGNASAAREAHASASRLSARLSELEAGARDHGVRWALYKKWRLEAAVMLDRSHAEAAQAVWESPPQPLDASELDELARAPAVGSLELFHQLTRQGIREASHANEQARLACIKKAQIQLMLDYPFSWRRRSNKGG